jgi:hypothetical protein
MLRAWSASRLDRAEERGFINDSGRFLYIKSRVFLGKVIIDEVSVLLKSPWAR